MKSNLKPSTEMQKDMGSSNSLSAGTPTANVNNNIPSALKSIDANMKRLAQILFQVKKLESSSKILPPELEEEAKRLVSSLREEAVIFHGLLGKCWINGNDCHLLNDELDISRHFSKEESMNEELLIARSKIPMLPPTAVGILVFSNKLQILFADGTSRDMETV